jgi:glycosyltransferase involved in cell wall biosynthesis
MRILIYNWRDLAHPKAGGAEVYTDQIARHWVEAGHDVTLFCSAVDGKSERETVDGGYQVVRRGGPHGVYGEARKYWEREARGHFDLVIDEVNTRPFGCPRWVTGVPVIALIHQVAREIWFHETLWPIALVGRYWLEPHWLAAYRDIPTVTLSESSRQSLRNYGLRNVAVVPVGFDPLVITEPLPTKEPTPTFVFVGRLAWNKRPHDAIEAFSFARKEMPNARLWVIGTGPMEQKLRERATPGVEFLGWVDEKDKLNRIARSHALLVTSVREGWGLVVTEAASAGTLSIGYNVPGLRDSIAASGGILVNPQPNDLGSTLIAKLPALLAGTHRVVPGGVTSWEQVATSVLANAPAFDPTEGQIRSAT